MATIRELRTQKGWSQHDLAIRIEVTAHTVYTWERGLRMPQVPQLRKLADVFEVPMESIDLMERQPSGDER